jgi:glycosyltransferase involved in cell wall biosynthesis
MFEIMACGRPIVGSVKGEARDILERSQGALIVDPEDSAAIARAIQSLRQAPELAHRLGEAGNRFVRDHYDRRALARLYLDLLSTIVARRELTT